MFKFLFRRSDKSILAGLQRYVDIEYRPSDRAAALRSLLREARS